MSAITAVAANLLTISLVAPSAHAADDSSAPLTAAVRQYFHHLDQHWVKDFDHVPPGLPLTPEVRTQFTRKVGTIADSRAMLTRHGIAVDHYTDTVALVGDATFASDRRSASATFAVDRTRTFSNPKFDTPRDETLTDQYAVTFTRSQETTGLRRWLIASIAVPAPPPDDEGATVPGVPAVGNPADATIPDTFAAAPKAGIALRPRGELQTEAASQALDDLDYGAMADYAIRWSGRWFGTEGEAYNPDYPRYGNNCQNFVSQSLYAGGWPEEQASPLQVEDDSKWDGHVDPWVVDLYRTTITWRATSHWQSFATNSGRVTWMPYLFDAALGDVIQTDWDPDNIPDGTVDHAMIVTDWDNVFGPYISQNSPHRQNIPLVLSMQYAQEQGKNDIVWYLART